MARNPNLASFMNRYCPLAMAAEGHFGGPWAVGNNKRRLKKENFT